MNSYDYNYVVSRQEREALKEIIFSRVKERAESLNKDTQEQYTSSFKNDLMDIARASIADTKNPFAIDISKQEASKEVVKPEPKKDIGFPEYSVKKEIKNLIEHRNNLVKESISQNEVQSVMKDAVSIKMTDKSSFMGALNFLNSQASLSLINNRRKGLDTIA